METLGFKHYIKHYLANKYILFTFQFFGNIFFFYSVLLAQMDTISVHLSYPSFSPDPPSLSPLPIPRSRSSYLSNRPSCPHGTVDAYDVTELNDQLRYFGISEETRKALRKKRSTRSSPPTRPPTAFSMLNNTNYTNKNAQFKSREQLITSVLRPVPTRSCYVDFTGSFKEAVFAHSLPLATRRSAQDPRLRTARLPLRSVVTTAQEKHAKKTTVTPVVSEAAHIKDGLLIIANGQIVDLKKDIKQSEKLDETERKRLRKEMREQLHVVNSFDKLMEKFDQTKAQIDKLKCR